MHRIACPYCGPRDESEFQYQGDATVTRPRIETESERDMDALFAYVHVRRNPKGLHLELWHHAGGCRQYLKVERDTRTHEIVSVALAAGRDGGGGG